MCPIGCIRTAKQHAFISKCAPISKMCLVTQIPTKYLQDLDWGAFYYISHAKLAKDHASARGICARAYLVIGATLTRHCAIFGSN